jgi:hypothetical protein
VELLGADLGGQLGGQNLDILFNERLQVLHHQHLPAIPEMPAQ